MIKDLKTQINVVTALIVHNMQGQMSTYRYGFAWMILEPLVFIAGFRLMRQLLGSAASPPGMTPLMFYVLGVFPLYICMDGLRSYGIAAGRSRLLDFPRVTPLDVTLATTLSTFATYFLLFWLVAVPVSIYEGAWPPNNIIPVMFSLVAGWMFGTSLGLIISGPFRYFPPLRQFIGYANFAIRMGSGMFFCATMLPETVWPYFAWNPIFQLTEITRQGWFESYVSPVASPRFVVESILVAMLLGLSTERYMRRVPKI